MNSEERFKKQLNDLLESKDFPFDESNWESARKLIDRESGNRKGFFPYAITTLFLLLSGVFGFYFLSPTSSFAETKNPAKQKQQSPANISLPETKLSASTSVEALKIVKTTAKVPDVKSPTAQSQVISSSPHKTKVSKPDKANFSPEKTLVVNTPEPSLIISTKTDNEIKAIESIDGTTAAPIDNTYISKTTAPASEETKTSKAPQEVTKVAKSEPTNISNENLSASGNSDPQNSGLTSTPPALTEAETNANATQAPSNHGPDLITEPLVPAVINTSLTAVLPAIKPDTASGENHFDDANFPQKSRFPLLTFEAGSTYLFGWKNPTGTDAKGFNPLVGISYYTYLRPKVSVLIGVQYSSVGNLNYSSVTSRLTRYGMGEESQVTVITPQRIHYLIVPVKLNYHLNTKNTIGMGCNIAYLLTVDAKVESYEQGLNYTRDYNLGKTSGYTQGFKTFDAQLSLYYRRMIYKNLSVNAEGFFGLTDNKENKFFGLNVFERNKGFKLTLVYNLKNK